MRGLDIGPGDRPIAGWDTLDIAGAPTVVARWGDPLPIADDAYDAIHASHVLEHVPWERTHDALCEAFRILKPGGRIEIHVPDFDYIVQVYQGKANHDGWNCQGMNRDMDPFVWCASRLFSYERQGRNNRHCAIFDERYLVLRLRRAGFDQVARVPSNHHGRVDLGMEARKP